LDHMVETQGEYLGSTSLRRYVVFSFKGITWEHWPDTREFIILK